jgi:hypothetical protein
MKKSGVSLANLQHEGVRRDYSRLIKILQSGLHRHLNDTAHDCGPSILDLWPVFNQTRIKLGSSDQIIMVSIKTRREMTLAVCSGRSPPPVPGKWQRRRYPVAMVVRHRNHANRCPDARFFNSRHATWCGRYFEHARYGTHQPLWRKNPVHGTAWVRRPRPTPTTN